jgi:N-acetylmuramoyl-L-alanine amidase
MPTALTESLFMPIPEQEAALRNPEFVERLADAHVRGIEAFLRERALGARR